MSIEINMSGKVVLVTGGVKGVGAGISLAYLRAGATVVACGRTEPESPLRSEQSEVEFISADVRDPQAVTAMMAQIVERHGRLDVVINNAGGSPFAMAAEASVKLHAAILDLNLSAPLNVAVAANAIMQEQESGGQILMISSVSARRASPGTAAYGAAKAGLDNLTRTLAVEWAPRVHVNGVAVGPIRTELAHLHYGDEAGVAAVAKTIALGRLAEPSDVANCCLFLSSPLASYVSGSTLLLDGGGERPAFLDAATVNRPE